MKTVAAHITGTIWTIDVAVGDAVAVGGTVAVIESMKMEMAVESEIAGTVTSLLATPGQAVNEGDPLVRIDETAVGG